MARLPRTSSGMLYQFVAFDKRAPFDDGVGNKVEGFEQQLETRAAFDYQRSSEVLIAERLQARQPIVVRVRANAATLLIENDWRMRDLRTGYWQDSNETIWVGKQYAVRTITPSEDRRWLDITVESGVTP